MGLHVYSTLATNQIYNTYPNKVAGRVSVRDEARKVVIRGGTGVVNKRGDVPRGVVTQITDEQYEVLKQNHVFNLHVQNKHLIVVKEVLDPEVMAADMGRDESDQGLPEDLKEIAPKVDLESQETKAMRKGK